MGSKLEGYDVKVSTMMPGWIEAAKNYAAQANFYDLEEMITSLQNLCKEEDKCEHPVRKAAFNDDVKLMEFLMSTSYDMNSEIWLGQTAFHVACDYGRKNVAKLIMESSRKYDIDLNAKADYGKTPFHLACLGGRTELVKLMIESSRTYGIDLNAGDTTGGTPFHDACWTGVQKTVQVLSDYHQEFGIDIHAKTKEGKSALDLVHRAMEIDSANESYDRDEINPLEELADLLSKSMFP